MTTKLRERAEEVLSNYLGIHDHESIHRLIDLYENFDRSDEEDEEMTKLGDRLGIDPMVIMAWLEFAMVILQSVIDNCPENNANRFARIVARPGLMQRVSLLNRIHSFSSSAAVKVNPFEFQRAVLSVGVRSTEADIVDLFNEVREG